MDEMSKLKEQLDKHYTNVYSSLYELYCYVIGDYQVTVSNDRLWFEEYNGDIVSLEEVLDNLELCDKKFIIYNLDLFKKFHDA